MQQEKALWKCPKCGREFKRRHQHHFCADPPETIDEYIAEQEEAVQPRLYELHALIRAAAPPMEERIVWRMPSYWKGQHIIQFAAYKNFVSLYAGPEAVAEFKDQLTAFEVANGSVRLPYTQPLPETLIRGIVRWCYRHYAH